MNNVTNSAPVGKVLLLSIRAMHAERIFQGTKTFELRKTLPQGDIRRVYLYESGGRGVVGCFDVAEVILKPIPELWETVGDQAASEARFTSYFAGRLVGFAIRISNPQKFSDPISLTKLRHIDP